MDRDIDEEVRTLRARASAECGYGQARATAFALSSVLPEAQIYVPHTPRSTQAKVIRRVEAIAGVYDPSNIVVHVPVRRFLRREDLQEHLAQITKRGVRRILLIAGDEEESHGQYSTSGEVLEDVSFASLGITGVGFAAHPQAHPRGVQKDVLDSALLYKLATAQKQGLETWIVMQISLTADTAVAYARWLRSQNVRVPIKVGILGPASFHDIRAIARDCGVATSVRSLGLKRAVQTFASMVLGRTHTRVFRDIAVALSDEPELDLDVHFFVMGADAFCDWIQEM